MAKKKAIKLEEVKPAEVKGLLRDVPLENPVELTSVTRFSSDHIIKIRYNAETKEITIEDIPAELKSDITLVSPGKEWSSDGIAMGEEPNGALILENATKVSGYAFRSNAVITSVRGDKVERLNTDCFRGCSNLEEAYFPNLIETYDIPVYTFADCTKLHTVDIGSNRQVLNNLFNNSPALRTLIIRRSTVCALQQYNANALGGIYNNPAESEIYVPSSLIASYQAANNWSTGYAAGLTFKAIEGSVYDLGSE